MSQQVERGVNNPLLTLLELVTVLVRRPGRLL